MGNPLLLKCRMCGMPLNREIVSKDDPELCFECAEEARAFTPTASDGAGEGELAEEATSSEELDT